jgi:hypothetical protein
MGSATSGQDSDDVELLVYVLDSNSIDEVATLLKAAGVCVERQLPLSGIVGIKAARSRIGELQRLPGIKLIREANSFQLPPFSENFPQ